jgi:hypothetical protein
MRDSKTEQAANLSTKFFTNENGNSLFKKFKGAFEHISDLYAFHAIVGYFRASGYYAIREHLQKVPEVKILVGINVDAISTEAKRRGLLFLVTRKKQEMNLFAGCVRTLNKPATQKKLRMAFSNSWKILSTRRSR